MVGCREMAKRAREIADSWHQSLTSGASGDPEGYTIPLSVGTQTGIGGHMWPLAGENRAETGETQSD